MLLWYISDWIIRSADYDVVTLERFLCYHIVMVSNYNDDKLL